jgi:hypothetical protein
LVHGAPLAVVDSAAAKTSSGQDLGRDEPDFGVRAVAVGSVALGELHALVCRRFAGGQERSGDVGAVAIGLVLDSPQRQSVARVPIGTLTSTISALIASGPLSRTEMVLTFGLVSLVPPSWRETWIASDGQLKATCSSASALAASGSIQGRLPAALRISAARRLVAISAGDGGASHARDY